MRGADSPAVGTGFGRHRNRTHRRARGGGAADAEPHGTRSPEGSGARGASPGTAVTQVGTAVMETAAGGGRQHSPGQGAGHWAGGLRRVPGGRAETQGVCGQPGRTRGPLPEPRSRSRCGSGSGCWAGWTSAATGRLGKAGGAGGLSAGPGSPLSREAAGVPQKDMETHHHHTLKSGLWPALRGTKTAELQQPPPSRPPLGHCCAGGVVRVCSLGPGSLSTHIGLLARISSLISSDVMNPSDKGSQRT